MGCHVKDIYLGGAGKITVLHLGWCDPNHSFGGVESVISGLLAHSASFGIRAIHKVLPSTNPGFLALGSTNVEIHFARFRSEFKDILCSQNVQVVHSHNVHRPNGSGIAAEIVSVCNELGVPHLTTVHDCGLFSNKEELRHARRVLQKSTCIATSAFNAAEMARSFGVRPIEIIQPGVAFPQQMPKAAPESTGTFCAPGRFTVSKGIMEAVIAVGHLSKVLGSLTILLSNRHRAHFGLQRVYLEQLDQIAEGFPNLEVRYFDGNVSFPELYSQTDVTLCLPRVPEGFGLVPLESVASGRPAIVTPTGGMVWVQEFNCIARTALQTQTQLLAILESALTERQRWYSVLSDEYSALKKKYDLSVSVSRYADNYNMLIRSSKSNRRKGFTGLFI